jgi:hypothetical protein
MNTITPDHTILLVMDYQSASFVRTSKKFLQQVGAQ